MAMSLEDLLAEEGFKGRKSKTMARASSGPVTTRIPMYPFRDEHQSVSSSRLKKTERAYSDMRRYNFNAESPATDRVKGRRSHDYATRSEKFESATNNETREKLDRRGSQLSSQNVNMSIGSSGQFSPDEIVEIKSDIERVEAGVQDNEVYQGTYQHGAYSPSLIARRHTNATGEWEKYENGSGENIQLTKRYGNSSNKHRPEGNSHNGDYQKRVKECGSSSNRLNRSTQNNNIFDENSSHRRVEIEQVATEPALDEAAIKAIISILSGHIKRFLKDPDFRISLHHTCFSALNFSEIEESLIAESKVIANLDQAIETVERAAEECATTKELKKAALQLSVITGLNSNDLKDGFTSVQGPLDDNCQGYFNYFAKPFGNIMDGERAICHDSSVDSQKYSVYREEAVDAITTALGCSLFNQKVRETCCRALLVLGGRISFSGKVMTEDWILKKAGFLDGPESEVIRDKKGFGESIPLDDKEEEATQDWLIKLSACLLIDGKKSFLDILSQRLASGHKELIRVCLTTVAWLSSTLALLPEAEFQQSAFSVIISQLKENLVNGECVEHKVLASMSVHNFSKLTG